MVYLTALAIATGISCGIWGVAASGLNLISFAGFAGTTTYFACPDLEGYRKVPKSFVCNLTGVIYAVLAIKLGDYFGSATISYLLTGLISFLMVYQYRLIDYLDYMPAAFMGCFTTFATGGDIRTLPSMICGYIVAMGCDYGGKYLYKLAGKE